MESNYIFPQGVDLKKLLTLVEKYNKDTKKFGDFDLWDFNPQELILKGNLVFKPENGVGFLKAVKNTYQNGYLKEDFEKICELAESLGGKQL